MNTIDVSWWIIVLQFVGYLVSFIVLGLILWFAFKYVSRNKSKSIAKNRYAKGELSLEEFEQIKREINKT